jgi:hypothetical protein
MWMALIVLIVGLGGGGLYIATRPPAPTPPINQQPVEHPQKPPETTVPVSQETAPSEQPTTQPANPNTTEHTEAGPAAPVHNTPKGNTRKPTRVEEVTPPKPVQPAVDTGKVRSWITQGDFFLKRGEYDSAVAAYQEGLNLDPSNQDLRDKLDKTKKARDIEKKILQQ